MKVETVATSPWNLFLFLDPEFLIKGGRDFLKEAKNEFCSFFFLIRNFK